MMQFNMYHHYTVDEHLLRCIGVLTEIETRRQSGVRARHELMHNIPAGHRTVLLYRAVPARYRQGPRRRPFDRRRAGRAALVPAARAFRGRNRTGRLAGGISSGHVEVAQSRDLSDRKTIENFAAVVQSLERLKLLAILTVADIRAVGPGVWNGWKAQLLRTLYYETEPVMTGGSPRSTGPSAWRRPKPSSAGASRLAARRWTPIGPRLSGLLAHGRSAAQAAHARFVHAAEDGKRWPPASASTSSGASPN